MSSIQLHSWNVNGLRAVHRKEFFVPYLRTHKPDIVCIQETKSHPEQLSDDLRYIDGYTSYFTSCDIKKGYSGVALYTTIEPEKVEHGMGIKKFDEEGRIITAYFKDFVLLNVYFPNGGQGQHRIDYKMEFYDAFLKHINKLRASGKNVIFCGDVNTAHTEIDLARPKENAERTGFLPFERAWIDGVIDNDYVDTFRAFHPEEPDKYSYWDVKTRARDRNVGWRIDYFFADKAFMNRVKNADILHNVLGSDHCPVTLELDLQ